MNENIKRNIIVMIALIPIVILMILIFVRLTEDNTSTDTTFETEDAAASYVFETIGEPMV